MQSKYRGSGDGFRPGSPFGGRNQRRGGGFSRSYSRPYSSPPAPPATKLEILMEAGRLAAEYLVSKGVISPSSLPRNLSNGSASQEFRGKGREDPALATFTEGRIPAMNRLGDAGSSAGYRKRRFEDDFDRFGSRRNGRGRRRTGFYSRGYDGPDWGGERGISGTLIERNKGSSDVMEEDDEDFAPGYSRDRRSGHEDVGSSISRVVGDEQHSKSEAVGESGSEFDDAGSKASSNGARKDVPPEGYTDMNEGADDGNFSNQQVVEAKIRESDELEKNSAEDLYVKKNSAEDLPLKYSAEDLPVKPDRVAEGGAIGDHNEGLLKLGSFPKVPTRPRSSLSHRSPFESRLGTECGKRAEVASGGEIVMVKDKPQIDGLVKDSHVGHSDISNCELPVNSADLDIQLFRQSEESQCVPQQSLPCSQTTISTADAGEKLHADEEEEFEKQISSSPPSASEEKDFSQLDVAKQTQSSLFTDIPSQDEEKTDASDQLKPISNSLIPKDDQDQSFLKMDEVKQKQSTSFKICDLNLMEAPEITEIPDDHILDDCRTSATLEEPEKQLSVDFVPPGNSKAKDAYDFNQLSGDAKIIPVIDLEDESLMEVNISSKSKNEIMYPVENILNHTAHSGDLPVIQDTYSLAISDYLGAAMSCSPSGPADLNNLQVGMGLHGGEGFPVVDDSIYGSLGDIGFMDVWDQPSQDYEKFF